MGTSPSSLVLAPVQPTGRSSAFVGMSLGRGHLGRRAARPWPPGTRVQARAHRLGPGSSDSESGCRPPGPLALSGEVGLSHFQMAFRSETSTQTRNDPRFNFRVNERHGHCAVCLVSGLRGFSSLGTDRAVRSSKIRSRVRGSTPETTKIIIQRSVGPVSPGADVGWGRPNYGLRSEPQG